MLMLMIFVICIICIYFKYSFSCILCYCFIIYDKIIICQYLLYYEVHLNDNIILWCSLCYIVLVRSLVNHFRLNCYYSHSESLFVFMIIVICMNLYYFIQMYHLISYLILYLILIYQYHQLILIWIII